MKYNRGFSILILSIGTFINLLQGCNSSSTKKQDDNPIVTFKFFNYPSGQIKEKHKYQNGQLQSIVYYNEKEKYYDSVKIDSIALYKHGKISLLKYSYNQDGTFNCDIYKDNKKVMHQQYDSSATLLLQEPFYISGIPKMKFSLKSSRTYYDKRFVDTLIIADNEVPKYHTAFRFQGFNAVLTDDYGSFEIRPENLRITSTQKTIKIVVEYYENVPEIGKIKKAPVGVDSVEILIR